MVKVLKDELFKKHRHGGERVFQKERRTYVTEIKCRQVVKQSFIGVKEGGNW